MAAALGSMVGFFLSLFIYLCDLYIQHEAQTHDPKIKELHAPPTEPARRPGEQGFHGVFVSPSCESQRRHRHYATSHILAPFLSQLVLLKSPLHCRALHFTFFSPTIIITDLLVLLLELNGFSLHTWVFFDSFLAIPRMLIVHYVVNTSRRIFTQHSLGFVSAHLKLLYSGVTV